MSTEENMQDQPVQMQAPEQQNPLSGGIERLTKVLKSVFIILAVVIIIIVKVAGKKKKKKTPPPAEPNAP